MTPLDEVPTPAILIDRRIMERNLRRMQSCADEAGVELWPHIKTHKMVSVLRRQLALGAKGATCAKLSEAEAMLPSGVRRIFLAHSLVDLRLAPRLKALAARLDELILAATSPGHFESLDRLLAEADVSLPVLMAVDTGLGREGVRSMEEAVALAKRIDESPRMRLLGLYTHEGHAYGITAPEEVRAMAGRVMSKLQTVVESIGGNVSLWPGCSVTAEIVARTPGIRAIRPGSYVFGDLLLSEVTGVMGQRDLALSVSTTVVDRPEPGLALIDAGSKVFSSDRTQAGILARCVGKPGLEVRRVSEEHGFVTGGGVDDLEIGETLRFTPAHVCPVVNLASRVWIGDETGGFEAHPVDARGCSV